MRPCPHLSVSRPARALAILAFALALAASPARAAWQPDGVPLSPMPVFPQGYGLSRAVADGAQGAYVSWLFEESLPDFSGTQYALRAQRVDVLGNRPAPWSASGSNILSWLDSSPSGPWNAIPVVLLPDGAGGAIHVSIVETFMVEYLQLLQIHHIAPNGTVTGVPNHSFAGPSFGTPVLDAAADADGAGGVILLGWAQTFAPPPDPAPPGDLFARRIDAGGNDLWPPRVIAPGASVWSGGIATVSDGTGGAFFAWAGTRPPGIVGLYVQHVDATGTIPQDWPEGGVLVSETAGVPLEVRLVRDGLGGVIAVWRDERTGNSRLYAHRVLDAGVVDPAVPANGRLVPTSSVSDVLVNLASDEQGGCFLVGAGDGTSRLHRLDGELLPRAGWPAEGIALHALPPSAGAVGLAADGAGGAFVSYRNGFGTAHPQGLYAQHFAGDGSYAPGWSSAGYRLSGHGQHSTLVRSGAGAIVAWNDDRPGHRGVYAQRIVPDGPVATQLALVAATAGRGRVALHWYAADAAGLAATIERRSAGSGWAPLGSATADGTGNLRYEDADITPGARFAYRAAWTEAGEPITTDEVWVDVPAGPALALSPPRPNPAAGRVTLAMTLAGHAPARLDVVDLAGRRVATRDLGAPGAGSHVVSLDETAALPPGLYVIQLLQDGETRSVRFLRTP